MGTISRLNSSMEPLLGMNMVRRLILERRDSLRCEDTHAALDAHASKRIFKLRTAATTYSIGLPTEGEHPAQVAVVTTEYEIQQRQQLFCKRTLFQQIFCARGVALLCSGKR